MGLYSKGKLIVRYEQNVFIFIDNILTGYKTNTVIEWPVGIFEIRLQDETVPKKIKIKVEENKCISIFFQKKK